MKPLIAVPDGLIPAPGEIEAVYVAEDASRRESFDGPLPVNLCYPRAMLHFGTIRNHLHADGSQWLPTLADLTSDGRMLRDMLHDNLRLDGCEETLLTAVVEPRYSYQ